MTGLKIRKVGASDLENLKVVIDSSQLFPSSMLDEMIAPYFEGEETSIWLTADSSEPSFIAYCAPEQLTEGTWNLYLIAVHPNMQGQGTGKQVLAYLENELRAKAARILIVETSGLAEFEQTRDFYRKCGYTEEARIRDFYQAGDDKIVFWKSLSD